MVDDLIRLKPPEMATCWLNICCNLASLEPPRVDILLICTTEDSTTLRDQIGFQSLAWRPSRLQRWISHGH